MTKKTVSQCKTCPWRVDADPFKIPNGYSVELHENLRGTCASGLESLPMGSMRVMACHYSQPGEEFACAGWLANQLGPGNNIGVRLQVLAGRLPIPEVDGPQHETFEDTLPKKKRGSMPAVCSSFSFVPPAGDENRRARARGEAPRRKNKERQRAAKTAKGSKTAT